MKKYLSIIFLFFVFAHLHAQNNPNFTQTEIVYGRKDGMALTMVKLSPTGSSNGRGIINVVSGNFISSFEWVPRYIERSKIYVNNGFTVFIVVHGSQPRYAIPDEIADIKRAVKFVRYHAKQYGIDPGKIGITGSSAGGHLSLMIGFSEDPAEFISKDPVDTVSSRVQAVAVYYPPTDFLNFGKLNNNPAVNPDFLRFAGVAGAFDFREWNDSTKTIATITDEARRLQIAKDISPTTHISPNDPPVYIVHGDADVVVPLQQSQLLVEKLKVAKIPHQLKIIKGKGHGWPGQEEETKAFVDWFEKYLL